VNDRPDRPAPRGAVFLDRDGTLVRDDPPGFLHRPADVRLLPGVAAGLRTLTRRGWPLVVISNQSGVARGLYGSEAFYATMDRLHQLLVPHGVQLAAAYFCPHHPDHTGPCDCRKPGPRLFARAARDLGLDLASSWYVGNRYRDVEPAIRFGGRGILLSRDAGSDDACRARAAGVARAPDFRAAVARIGTPTA
jgi:D-glycero-D-manno-heptose 1,7-bisphosphate phosphatase